MTRSKAWGILSCVLVVAAVLGVGLAQRSALASLQELTPGEYIPGRIVVKFKAAISTQAKEAANREHGTAMLPVASDAPFMLLEFPAGKSVAEMVSAYRKDPRVVYAEPDYIVRACWQPNDALYPSQWHLDNDEYGGIHMEEAWGVETGDPEVIVAVLDSGVAYEDYEDAKGQYYQAPDLGNTSFVAGYDFINGDNHPNDDFGHGTHVTGTIAQSTNNNVGVAGVAFGCSIMPVKVLDEIGYGSNTTVANGIYWATDHGARVINMSLGGPNYSFALQEACAYAYSHGVTLVAAAGNEGNGLNRPYYPAAYDDYVIAVGATRYDETRARYSNTGSYLDLAAPGGDKRVDQNGDGSGDGVLQQTFTEGHPTQLGYIYMEGTSMATPHVAGVAALLISHGTATTPDEVRDAIEASAEDKGTPGWDELYGWGLVDAYAALLSTGWPDYAVRGSATPEEQEVSRDEDATYTITMRNAGTNDDSYYLALTLNQADIAELSATEVIVSAGSFANLTLTVRDSAIGDYLTSVHITSQGDPAVSDDVNVNTHVITSATAMRDLPGTPFSVAARFAVEVEVLDYGLVGQVKETLPPGFTYLSSSLDPAQVSIDGQDVTFALQGEVRFSYNVQASDETGVYYFEGILADEGLNQAVVQGDTEVVVNWSPWFYDANADGIIQMSEAVNALVDYFEGFLTREKVIRVLQLYFNP